VSRFPSGRSLLGRGDGAELRAGGKTEPTENRFSGAISGFGPDAQLIQDPSHLSGVRIPG